MEKVASHAIALKPTVNGPSKQCKANNWADNGFRREKVAKLMQWHPDRGEH